MSKISKFLVTFKFILSGLIVNLTINASINTIHDSLDAQSLKREFDSIVFNSNMKFKNSHFNFDNLLRQIKSKNSSINSLVKTNDNSLHIYHCSERITHQRREITFLVYVLNIALKHSLEKKSNLDYNSDQILDFIVSIIVEKNKNTHEVFQEVCRFYEIYKCKNDNVNSKFNELVYSILKVIIINHNDNNTSEKGSPIYRNISFNLYRNLRSDLSRLLFISLCNDINPLRIYKIFLHSLITDNKYKKPIQDLVKNFIPKIVREKKLVFESLDLSSLKKDLTRYLKTFKPWGGGEICKNKSLYHVISTKIAKQLTLFIELLSQGF